MRFKSFVETTVVTTDGNVVSLSEGIDHIEALPIDKFIHTIRNLNKFIASEKLDGANLIFGFDSDGRFYTSREAKSGDRAYQIEDYKDTPANNGFKSAHAALNSVVPLLKSVLEAGDAVEVEVLFGRQPNAIVYGTSYIAFLRMVPGDNRKPPDQIKVKKLTEALKAKTVNVKTTIVKSDDGIDMVTQLTEFKWKFTSTTFIDSNVFKSIDLTKEISQLEKFLKEPNTVGNLGLTNGDILGINLGSVPKDVRAQVKDERERLVDVAQKEFKLRIKEKLLDQIVRKLQPALRDVEIGPHEDTGVEGLVFLNPETLEQFKIVDKDVFTIINQFNFAIRNQIKSVTRGRISPGSATLGHSVDIFNQLLERLAQLIGNDKLSHYSSITRALKQYQGKNRAETLSKFVGSFKNKDVSSVKGKAVSYIEDAINQLSESLKKYKEEWKQYELKLKTGKQIKYSDEIHSRTLLVFAETRKELLDMVNDVKKAKNLGDVTVALYGRSLDKLH